jgi:hypothetical protein
VTTTSAATEIDQVGTQFDGLGHIGIQFGKPSALWRRMSGNGTWASPSERHLFKRTD